MILFLKDIRGAEISDAEVSKSGVSFKVKIPSPPVVEICQDFKIEMTNDKLLTMVSDLRAKEQVVIVKSKFKLALPESLTLKFVPKTYGKITYKILEVEVSSQAKDINGDSKEKQEKEKSKENPIQIPNENQQK